MGTAAEVKTWFEEQKESTTAQQAVDAANWVVAGGASSKGNLASEGFKVGKLPKGVKVTILYGASDKEDDDLNNALEAHGATVQVRNEADKDVSDAIFDEVQVMSAADEVEETQREE